MKFNAILFSMLLFLAHASFAAKHLVTTSAESGDGSLREAISLAQDGDEIYFDGPYTIVLDSALEIRNKSITIAGKKNGLVTIDGNFNDTDNDHIDDDGSFTQVMRVINEQSIAPMQVRLQYLSIENGALVIDNSKPETDSLLGAGLYADLTEGDSLIVEGCRFEKNMLISLVKNPSSNLSWMPMQGAGVYVTTSALFKNCSFKFNKIMIADKDNSIPYHLEGAGLMANNVSLDACLFLGNSIINNHSVNLRSIGFGAAACIESATVSNSVIVGNRIAGYVVNAMMSGGGFYMRGGRVVNSDFAYNSLSFPDEPEFGGVMLDQVKADNCIFYTSNPFVTIMVTPQIDATNIAIADADYAFTDKSWKLIESSPFVADPDPGLDKQWGTFDDYEGDLHLKDTSFLIDAGHADVDAKSADFAGDLRIMGEGIDIGAFEFNPDADGDGVDVPEDVFPHDKTEWADCDGDGIGDNSDPEPCVHNDLFSLKGSVTGASDEACVGTVSAYAKQEPFKPVASCKLDDEGNFVFEKLIAGEYFIKASPVDNKYSDTFFGNETEIQNSPAISLNDNIYDVDIRLQLKATTAATESKTALCIYPVPLKNRLYVDANQQVVSVVIVDCSGKNVIESRSSSINVSRLPKGAYVVCAKLSDGRFVRKAVIK